MRRNSGWVVFAGAIGFFALGGVGMTMWGRLHRSASPADPTNAAQVAAGQVV